MKSKIFVKYLEQCSAHSKHYIVSVKKINPIYIFFFFNFLSLGLSAAFKIIDYPFKTASLLVKLCSLAGRLVESTENPEHWQRLVSGYC